MIYGPVGGGSNWLTFTTFTDTTFKGPFKYHEVQTCTHCTQMFAYISMPYNPQNMHAHTHARADTHMCAHTHTHTHTHTLKSQAGFL